MSNNSETTGSTVEAPKIFFTISWMWKETLVFAFKIWKIFSQFNKEMRDIFFISMSIHSLFMYIFIYLFLFLSTWIKKNSPLPGSGVVGGSGVVNLLLSDSSIFEFSAGLLSRFFCFLRPPLSEERILERFLFILDLVGFSLTLTKFLSSSSSSKMSSSFSSICEALVLDLLFDFRELILFLVGGSVVLVLLLDDEYCLPDELLWLDWVLVDFLRVDFSLISSRFLKFSNF